MKVTSPEFDDNGLIPVRFTCEGENISPPFDIKDIPIRAAGLCLVMDDPDAPGGTFTHWIAYNLPPTLASLEEGVSVKDLFSGIAKEGINSFGDVGYDGPCPPHRAGDHHYYFHFYAVNCQLDLPEGASRREVMEGLRRCVLEEAILMGRFGRD